MIKHETPDSSNIRQLHYDSERGVLQVDFRSGSSYQYEGVNYDTWNAMISAPSVGKFFNAGIKGRYNERKV